MRNRTNQIQKSILMIGQIICIQVNNLLGESNHSILGNRT